MSQSENMVQVSNEHGYFSSRVLKSYTSHMLMRTEAIALLKYQPAFADRDVLDIGIGSGRTTIYLAPLAKRYVGIDYSPTFVDHTQKTMPQVRTQLGDMRDLNGFGAEEFDFVMASYNVIDCVSHEDRLKTLSEVYRVLKPGGIFLFSSHNRAYESTGKGPKLELSIDPFRQAKRAARWLIRLRNHAKWKKQHVFTDTYAIVTDEAFDFSALHYYITQKYQRRQLEESNFTTLEVFDIVGNLLAPQAVDTQSPWLMYVAQKRLSSS